MFLHSHPTILYVMWTWLLSPTSPGSPIGSAYGNPDFNQTIELLYPSSRLETMTVLCQTLFTEENVMARILCTFISRQIAHFICSLHFVVYAWTTSLMFNFSWTPYRHVYDFLQYHMDILFNTYYSTNIATFIILYKLFSILKNFQ